MRIEPKVGGGVRRRFRYAVQCLVPAKAEDEPATPEAEDGSDAGALPRGQSFAVAGGLLAGIYGRKAEATPKELPRGQSMAVAGGLLSGIYGRKAEAGTSMPPIMRADSPW